MPFARASPKSTHHEFIHPYRPRCKRTRVHDAWEGGRASLGELVAMVDRIAAEKRSALQIVEAVRAFAAQSADNLRSHLSGLPAIAPRAEHGPATGARPRARRHRWTGAGDGVSPHAGRRR